ncbi:MAG: hypothetical protein GC159_00750 [Phycisphaera sp.]|nr:hypothetical protein [Phycisphaera sp.]
MIAPMDFCRRLVYLNGHPIRFDERPYLREVYAQTAGNLVIRASRQVEKSTFLVNTILYEAFVHPGAKILFITPRDEQSRLFSNSRLIPTLKESPLLRQRLLGTRPKQPKVTNLIFENGSQVYVRSAFRSADASRGISADLLVIDEIQDVAPGDLPVLQETLSHSARGRTIATGTPKTISNHIEDLFCRSTACEWLVDCRCGAVVAPDDRCLGVDGPRCQACGELVDFTQGRWVARNPESTWGAGFTINHLLVPWIGYPQVLDRQRNYSLPKFKNEVLGLPTTAGDLVVTPAEVEACCGQSRLARRRSDLPPAVQRVPLFAGIDWGGGGTSTTVITVGYMTSDYVFHLVNLTRFPAREDPMEILDAVATTCTQLGVAHIAADGMGNGIVYNRLLQERLGRRDGLYAIQYGQSEQEPRCDGALYQWMVGRSRSIGVLFSRIKKRSLRFPRLDDIRPFINDYTCVFAEYDDHNRAVRYTHPDHLPDDALHASNYALLIATRAFNAPTYGA